MKKEIQYIVITLGFTLIHLFMGCSAVPTAGRYSQDGDDQTTTTDNQQRDNSTINQSPGFTINYDEVFSGFNEQFVRIPEKIQSVSKSGVFWYRYPESAESDVATTEADGFTLLVFLSGSAEAADSVEALLFEKTGINDITVNFASGKYQVFYGSYPDFSSAAEAVIKLNENNFTNCLPVPKKINIRKKF